MLFSGNEPVSSPQNALMARQDSSSSSPHHRSVLRALDWLIAGEKHICLLGASSPIDQTHCSGIFGLLGGARWPFLVAADMVMWVLLAVGCWLLGWLLGAFAGTIPK